MTSHAQKRLIARVKALTHGITSDLDVFRGWHIKSSKQEQVHCECGQAIQTSFVLERKDAEAPITLGSTCVERFMGDECASVARSIQIYLKDRVDTGGCPNCQCIRCVCGDGLSAPCSLCDQVLNLKNEMEDHVRTQHPEQFNTRYMTKCNGCHELIHYKENETKHCKDWSAVFRFGKHKEKLVKDVDLSYVLWCASNLVGLPLEKNSPAIVECFERSVLAFESNSLDRVTPGPDQWRQRKMFLNNKMEFAKFVSDRHPHILPRLNVCMEELIKQARQSKAEYEKEFGKIPRAKKHKKN